MAKTGELSLRIDDETITVFKNKCSDELKRQYQNVVREMIEAFNEGRLKIKPTESQKNAIGSLYDVN